MMTDGTEERQFLYAEDAVRHWKQSWKTLLTSNQKILYEIIYSTSIKDVAQLFKVVSIES